MAVISDIEIRLRADIARLQTDMNAARRSVDGAMGGITRAAQQARNALGGIAAGIGVSQIASMVDQYVKFTSQLKLATQSQREYNTAYADVKRIAAGSTQGLQETGILYARIANGTRELGVSQKQLSNIVETVNLSLLVSGATASEAASAQLQLSQAFASGTLRGEEFNSVNEAAPRLMKALADGIGVPVGALKKMAEEGLITSEIMANVLPKALVALREEAKNIQTISGSFTLLKNSTIEFVGSTAQASGAVSAIASLLTTLANNLHLVAGAMLTVVAVKLVNFLDMMVTRTMASVAANNALIASNIATAQATATATAQASLLANARLAEIRAATLGAASNIRLALTTNGLIPAQRAAAAAAATHSAAMLGLVTAQGAAAVSTRALNAALALTGGPFGLIITILGIAATAWGAYEYAQNKANEKAAADTKASAGEITENLSKVNAMLRERIELQRAGASEAVTGEGTGSQELRETLKEINDLKAQGAALDASDQIRLISLQGIYNALNKEISDNAALKRESDANGQIAKDVITVRERLNGVNQQYIKDLGVLKSALDKGAISQGEYTQLVSKLASETYKSSDAYKEAKSNAEKAANASKQQAEAYRDLIYSLQERVDVTAREAAGLRPLNDAEKAHLDLTKQITNGKLKLTASQQARARSLINEARANDVLAASEKEYAELQETLTKAAKELSSERMSLIESARQEAEQNELAIKTYGMSEAAIIRLTTSRLLDQEAQRLGRTLTAEEIADLQRVIDLKERSAKAVANKAELEATKAFWTDIEKTAHDTFVSIADGGKNAFQRLKDTAKNTFFDWLYQQTLKKWIINIGTSTDGVDLSSLAGGPSGSSGGISMDKIFSAFKSGGTLEKSIAESVQKGFDSAGLSPGGGTPGQAAQWAGKLGSTIGGYMAGSALNKGISGGYETGSGFMKAEKLATAVGSYINPVLGAAIGAISGVVNRAFGMKPKEYGNKSIIGEFGGDGFSGTLDTPWTQKGGWFRSNKKGVDSKPIEEALSSGLAQAYEAIKTSSSMYADALGIDAKSIADRAQKVKIALGKDGLENEKAITDFLAGVADSVAKELLPAVGQFSKIGETASQTFERIAVGYKVVEDSLKSIGGSFGSVGIDSIAARERLIELSGGLQEFSTNVSGFQQNFLTEAERNAPVLERVTEKLKELGLASVSTRDQFRDAVLSLTKNGSLATAEGAKKYAELMALQADVAQSFPDAAAARGLEIELLRLQGRESEALASERKYELAAMEKAFRPLQERIYALRDEAAAAETANSLLNIQAQIYELNGDKAGAASVLTKQHAAALVLLDPALRGATQELWALEAAAKAIEKAKSTSTKLVEGVEDAFSVLKNISESQKTLLEADVKAREKSVQSLKKISDSARAAAESYRTPDDLRKDQSVAIAQITAAVAKARSGGGLPDEKYLEKAIKDLGSGIEENNYESFNDYQRDVALTRNALGELAYLSDDALTIEEKSLQAVESQIELINMTLEKAQEQVDVLKGISVVGLSIEQAIRALDLSLAVANKDPLTASKAAINNAYKEALGRAPDAAGFEWWTDKVAGGAAIGDVVNSIAQSGEAQIAKMYREVLGREADSAGVAFWSKAFGGSVDSTEYAQFIKGAQPELDMMDRQKRQMESAALLPGSGTMSSSGTSNNAAEMAEMKVYMAQTAASVTQLANQFNQVSGGGNSLLTEPA